MKLEDHGFFLARQPLLGLDIFDKWAAASDKNRFVREMLEQESFRQALYIASPSLHERCMAHFGPNADSTSSQKGLDEDKLYLALSKYLARAAYRCTPFGMFAASTPGRIAEESALGLDDGASPVLRIRYDFAVQAQIVNWLMRDHSLRMKLRYTRNNSFSQHGKKLFYVASNTDANNVNNANGRKQYQFNQVECEPHLDAILQLAQQHVPFEQLQACLVERAAVSAADAQAYLHQLIDSEILVAEIGLTITGGDSFETLLTSLEAIGERHRLAVFEEVLLSLTARIAQEQVDWIALFESAFETLSAANCIALDKKNLFQVDMKRQHEVKLASALSQKIAHASTLLAKLTMRRLNFIDEFKKNFLTRFDDKEVPLALVFNEELGIPFPRPGKVISDLLNGIDFPALENTSEKEIAWSQFDDLLFARYQEALASGQKVIHLQEQDIAHIQINKATPFLHGGVYTTANLFSHDDNAQEDGENIGVFIQTTSGRSGFELFGRICDLDAGLAAKVSQSLQEQDADDDTTVYAEVVHLPQDRIVNVVARPVLSHYEIPYLGKSGVDAEHQILLDDLMLSVRDKRFVLRSMRLNKFVIPRLTSAHNYAVNNISLYRFLCGLGWQDQPKVGFSWAAIYRQCGFLPRVTLAGVTISLATWRLSQVDIAALAGALAVSNVAEDGQANISALQEWRAKRQMPRYITFDVGDNVLPIDLENPLLVQVLLDEVANAERIEVREAIALNSQSSQGARNSLGLHHAEVLMPYRVLLDEQQQALQQKAAQQRQILLQRHLASPQQQGNKLGEPYVFLPGSSWASYKLYCGQSQMDELLARYLAPTMQRLLHQGAISQWYFLRYADPEHHLRLRAFSNSNEGRIAVQAALANACSQAINDGLGWKLVSDSYVREVARYGGLAAIAHCEALFHLDSELIATLLQSANKAIPPSWRLLYAVLFAIALFDAFALDQNQRTALVEQLAHGYRQEFGFGLQQKVQLGAKYRSYREQLDKLIFARGEGNGNFGLRSKWLGFIARYQAQIVAHASALRQMADSAQLEGKLVDVIASLLHMHCNRLFVANQREHELVFFDFLQRIQQSMAATNAGREKVMAAAQLVQMAE